jgi:hypothetical protein
MARTSWAGSATSSLLAEDYTERGVKSGSLCGQDVQEVRELDGEANPIQIQAVFLFCVDQIFVMLLTGTLSGGSVKSFWHMCNSMVRIKKYFRGCCIVL